MRVWWRYLYILEFGGDISNILEFGGNISNILEFGGDISNISLMGESAGSMSALLHLVSPVSQGLFHR